MKSCIFVSMLFLVGCAGGNNQSVDDRPPFFTGRFVYFADAAVITDCATAVRLPVSMSGSFIAAQQAYSELQPEMGEAIFVEFFGRIVDQPAMEGDGMERAFVIDSLIGFDRNRDCDPEWIVSGLYDSHDDGRRILRLSPDYTFTETLFDLDSGKSLAEWTGYWRRTAELELVLETRLPEPALAKFQIIPAQESLSRNDGNKPLVFKKVYL